MKKRNSIHDNDPTGKAWDDVFNNKANKIDLSAPRGKSKSGKMLDY